MIVEIKIAELIVGHYVVDIIEQQGSFKLNSAAHIKSAAVIKNLQSKGVLSLSIDTSKTLISNPVPTKEQIKETNKKKVIVELKKAKELFNQSKLIQQKVFSDAQHGLPMDLSPVVEITNKTIETVFENSDALACVFNIRN